MLVPIDLRLIDRGIPTKAKVRKLFLLSEGTLTEPSFLKTILSRSDYLKSKDDVEFYEVERSGREFGKNTLSNMIDIAYQSIIDKKSVRFKKKRDKVIIFFDLDIYHESLEQIKQMVETHKKHIVFVFTNPAVELFLLLCKKNSYEEIIEPEIDKILKNEKNETTGNRYIHQLVIDKMGVDPKNNESDFSVFSSGLENGILQEKLYMSKRLTNLNKNLISNFGEVIESIKNGEIDNIKYTIFE